MERAELLKFLGDEKLYHHHSDQEDPTYQEMVDNVLWCLRNTPDDARQTLLGDIQSTLVSGIPAYSFSDSGTARFFSDILLQVLRSEEQTS